MFFVGLAVGVGGYFLYDRYFSSARKLGYELLERAGGDVARARQHLAKLIA